MNSSKGSSDFASIAGQFAQASGYNICQIARLAGLPRMTLVNWLDGVTNKPRSWQDIVKLATALKLDTAQTDELLLAAHYSALAQLHLQSQQEADQQLLVYWDDVPAAPSRLSPFSGHS